MGCVRMDNQGRLFCKVAYQTSAIFVATVKAVAYLFSHIIQGYAVGTADVALPAVVRPGAQNEQAAGGARIEQCICRLVVVAEAIVCQQDEGVTFFQ